MLSCVCVCARARACVHVGVCPCKCTCARACAGMIRVDERMISQWVDVGVTVLSERAGATHGASTRMRSKAASCPSVLEGAPSGSHSNRGILAPLATVTTTHGECSFFRRGSVMLLIRLALASLASTTPVASLGAPTPPQSSAECISSSTPRVLLPGAAHMSNTHDPGSTRSSSGGSIDTSS